MEESYERLKIKLNIKDQRLNEKDAQIEELKQTIQARRQDLPPEDQERVQALLSGASPRTQEESTFIQQAATVVRLLQRVMELDRAVNLRLTGSSSVYNKK